jgi:conflict system STAND superfamily ATPase
MTAPAQTPSEGADACLATLDDAGQAIARRVVLRLLSFRDGRAEPGRPQPLSALGGPGDAGRLADVVRHLADGGGVRLDDDASVALALAGDALTGSPVLQRWITSHGQAEQLRRQLEADATAWKQGTAGLLDPAQLAELAAWLTPEIHRDIGVSEVADALIAASRAPRRRGWWPGRTAIGGTLAIVLILMILATPITLASLIALTAAMIHKFL